MKCSSTNTALCQKVLTDFPAEYRQRDPRIAWTLPLPEPRNLTSQHWTTLPLLLPASYWSLPWEPMIQLPTGVQASYAQDSQRHSPQPLYWCQPHSDGHLLGTFGVSISHLALGTRLLTAFHTKLMSIWQPRINRCLTYDKFTTIRARFISIAKYIKVSHFEGSR